MAGMKNVIRFYRGMRRHPKWDMGRPPNPRGRKPFRPVGRGARTKLLLATVGLVLVGPVGLDAASLMWRKSEGCAILTVIDGDTVRLLCPNEGFVSGRILGYDAPEMKARCPRELIKAVSATYYLHWQLWRAGEVVATPRGRDRYDRVLALVAFDGEGVGRRMVDAGLGRWYQGGKRRGWCEGEAA